MVTVMPTFGCQPWSLSDCCFVCVCVCCAPQGLPELASLLLQFSQPHLLKDLAARQELVQGLCTQINHAFFPRYARCGECRRLAQGPRPRPHRARAAVQHAHLREDLVLATSQRSHVVSESVSAACTCALHGSAARDPGHALRQLMVDAADSSGHARPCWCDGIMHPERGAWPKHGHAGHASQHLFILYAPAESHSMQHGNNR